MNKKKGPALYELISSKQVADTNFSREAPCNDEHDVDLEHNVLTPGRAVRMSIGTIGVVTAVCIALIVISYTMGFRKGSAIAREDYGNRLFEEFPAKSINGQEQTNVAIVSPAQPMPTHPQSTAATSDSPWGPILSDPRAPNTFYYTLMQTTREGAEQLASFCRQKGLETYVVSGNNTRLYRVFALPGFQNRNDQGALDLRMKIRSIGQAWAEDDGRGDDLHDAYLSLYQGG